MENSTYSLTDMTTSATQSTTVTPDTLKVVLLAVFLAIFVISTIALVIYILITKCRNQPKPDPENILVEKHERQVKIVDGVASLDPDLVDPIQEDHNNVAGASSGPNEQEGGEGSIAGEEDDQLGPLEQDRFKVKPKLSCRYKCNTLDIFTSDTIVAERASKIGILKAAQVSYEHFSEGPERGLMRSIYGAKRGVDKSIESILEESMIQTVPVIEEVSMVNVTDLGKAPVSIAHQPVTTPTEFRPKSFFNTAEGGRAAAKPEADVSHGMFVSKTLTQTGGIISLYGVTLDIPSGALPKSTAITLGILWSADHQPKLPKQEAILSPIISCEPHGLQLQKEATLTFPHCAHNIKNDWKFHILSSESRTIDKPKWSKCVDAKYEYKDKSKIKVHIPHFTLYTGIGEGGKKWVDLIAVAPPLEGTLFQLRVFCINDYEEEDAKDSKKMKKQMDKLNAKEMTEEKLLIHPDNKNVQLSLSVDKSCTEWTLADMCAQTQEMDFELVWQSACPSCKFVLNSGDTKSSKVMCKVESCQIGHMDKKRELYIAEEKHIQTQTDSRIDVTELEAVFPEQLRDTIIKHLDPDYTAASNWVHLAEEMGKPLQNIYWLTNEYMKTGRSPTIHLLKDWVTSRKTLEQFDDVMVKLKRNDIHDEIVEWKSQKRNSKKT